MLPAAATEPAICPGTEMPSFARILLAFCLRQCHPAVWYQNLSHQNTILFFGKTDHIAAFPF